MVRDVNGRFDDYSISPKIRQLLLHWSYEFWFKREKNIENARDKYQSKGGKKIY